MIKDSQTAINHQIGCRADFVNQGGANLPAKSWLVQKKSKPRSWSRAEKETNQHLAASWI